MPTCPVCSYDRLKNPPRAPSGGGSYEICPACGFQFGVDDDDRGISYAQWRREWKKQGMPWFSKSLPQPANWPPPPKAAKRVATKPKGPSSGKKPGKPRKS
jgi:hypothetical protein